MVVFLYSSTLRETFLKWHDTNESANQICNSNQVKSYCLWTHTGAQQKVSMTLARCQAGISALSGKCITLSRLSFCSHHCVQSELRKRDQALELACLDSNSSEWRTCYLSLGKPFTGFLAQFPHLCKHNRAYLMGLFRE